MNDCDGQACKRRLEAGLHVAAASFRGFQTLVTIEIFQIGLLIDQKLILIRNLKDTVHDQ